MIAVLNIEETKFFNKNLIKVFDGIAGSAKSSTCSYILNGAGVSFLRCTSTNKLKKDAERRFGGSNATIASGLFNTVDGEFYKNEKAINFDTVLIDEALQADTSIFDWCINHVGEVNIIICTDSKQMLPPSSVGLLTLFKEFCSRPDVLYTPLDKTLRASDNKTKDAYNTCYKYADEETNALYSHYKKDFEIVEFKDIIYNPNDAFITHTNEIEKFLYNIWDMPNRYDAPLIPKGTIASKDITDITKYPIVPQANTNRVDSYFQIENIGTVTRYQGSEVEKENTLYYFVEHKSYVENREFYTMITRAKSLDSIKLVYINPPKKVTLTTYNGCPVIPKKWGEASSDMVMDTDGTTLKEVLEKKGEITHSEKNYILNKLNEGDHSSYIYGFSVDGARVKEETERTNKVTMNSLIKKEPLLRAEFMGEFYKIYDEIQQEYGDTYSKGGNIWTPANIDSPQRGMPDNYKYGVDMYSAYPHCFKFGAMPDGRTFYSRDIKNEYEAKTEGLIRFYVNFSRYGAHSMIFTGELTDYIKENGITSKNDFIYIGACHRLKTSIIGDYLMQKAYKTETTKKSLKNIHYGYMQKPYIEPAFYNDRGQVESYITNDGQTLELCMVCVQSELALQMLKIKMAVYNNIEEGYTQTDCLYFNSNDEEFLTFMAIQDATPNYDFRIIDNTGDATKTSEKPVIYQTYETLKKRSHHKKKG